MKTSAMLVSIASSIALFALVAAPSDATSTMDSTLWTTGTWSYDPPSVSPLPMATAELTSNGKTTPVTIGTFNANTGIMKTREISNSGAIQPNDFWGIQGYFHYVGYSQLGASYDPYRYYIGQTTTNNHTLNPVLLQYSQQSSVTTTWSTSGNIGTDASAGEDVLANLHTGISYGYTYSTTVQHTQSSIATDTITVPSGHNGLIKAFNGGGYSYGTATWVLTAFNGQTSLYQENDSTWAPSENNTNYQTSVW